MSPAQHDSLSEEAAIGPGISWLNPELLTLALLGLSLQHFLEVHIDPTCHRTKQAGQASSNKQAGQASSALGKLKPLSRASGQLRMPMGAEPSRAFAPTRGPDDQDAGRCQSIAEEPHWTEPR